MHKVNMGISFPANLVQFVKNNILLRNFIWLISSNFIQTKKHEKKYNLHGDDEKAN